MKLYKLIVIKLFTYGIPAIPVFFAYEITVPYVIKDTVTDLVFGLTVLYIILFMVNIGLFDGEYKKYLHEVDAKDENKEGKIKW